MGIHSPWQKAHSQMPSRASQLPGVRSGCRGDSPGRLGGLKVFVRFQGGASGFLAGATFQGHGP